MQNGQYADQQSSKKVLFGLAGALGGAGVAVGVLLAIAGLVDTRFRYSDDAAGNSMSGIPLLGILPNLPDKLTDPAQASVAAHCVHQIRTMLQLNAMREACTVFAITSASSGDGKTSLSLALGLSFAASGSRTLLIDADLVGGGLSSRLGNNSSIGIVDAISGTKIDDVVQATDVADLAIIPIGSAQAHHAGSFSPPAVRRFLAEARKHFEVIVIDTGRSWARSRPPRSAPASTASSSPSPAARAGRWSSVRSRTSRASAPRSAAWSSTGPSTRTSSSRSARSASARPAARR
jgi:hypothetical protein